jgi:PAS domain S-box-containing protein
VRRGIEDSKVEPSALRLLVAAIVGLGLVTLGLAVEALSQKREGLLSGGAWLALVLVPVVWLVTARSCRVRTRAVRETFRTSQRLSAVVATTGDIVWETTTDGIITYVNDRARDMLGYRPEDVIGQGMDIVLHPYEHERAFTLFGEALSTRRGWTHEPFTMLTYDGQQKEVFSSALVHLSATGEPIAFTGTLREVHVGRELEEELDRIRAATEAVMRTTALRPVFQPIVSLASGAVIGAEALTRFTADPPQAPDVWFQQAHQAGLGCELELLAIQTALEHAPQLPAHVYVSVNVSPATLLTGRLHQLLVSAPWAARQTVVEITEHVSVDDYQPLADAVAKLRELGARIAVDDAGAGYASFRHILQLRPDYIKLDRALIDGLDHDPAKRALAGAFVTFGQEIGATIVAEGVETAEEVRAARALGMHAAQGYYTGRPAPADRLWGVGLGVN